jgi:hypothetical protein
VTWRYMASRETIDEDADEKVYWWGIREVYTSANGEISWTAEAIPAGGEGRDELIADLRRMLADAEAGKFLDVTAEVLT